MNADPASAPRDEPEDRSAEVALPYMGQILRRVGALVLLVAGVVLLIGALPGLDEVRDRFQRADPLWLVVAFVCALTSVISYVAALRGVFDRRLDWRASWTVGTAEQGGNVLLPTGGVGGVALGAVLLRRAGVPTAFAAARSAALFFLTSLASFATLVLAGTLTWVGVLPGSPGWVGTLLPAGLAALVILGVGMLGLLPATPAPPGRGLRRRVRQARWVVRQGVRESAGLIAARDRLALAGSAGYLAFDIAATGAAFQAFGGGGPRVGPFVLAYVLGQAGALIPTPGGVGGTDGGLIGMFILYGTPAGLAAAGVLAYRVFQLGLPVIFGVISFARIRHFLRHGPAAEEVAARFAGVG